MPGYSVLHVWCTCGRFSTIRKTEAMRDLLRDALLRRLRCMVCGGRACDLVQGWDLGEVQPAWYPPPEAAPPVADVIPIAKRRRRRRR